LAVDVDGSIWVFLLGFPRFGGEQVGLVFSGKIKMIRSELAADPKPSRTPPDNATCCREETADQKKRHNFQKKIIIIIDREDETSEPTQQMDNNQQTSLVIITHQTIDQHPTCRTDRIQAAHTRATTGRRRSPFS
jgi:hypothetical protein